MISTKLAWRELKNNLPYWCVLGLNLTIGLLGFCFILIFRNNVNATLESRNKEILSADLVVSGRRVPTQIEQKHINEILLPHADRQTKLTTVYSMGLGENSQGKTRLLYVKAITGDYPLIGKINLKTSGQVSSSEIKTLNKRPLIWVAKEVLHQFKSKLGDKIKLGQVEFTIADVIESDSTTTFRGVSLAPKVYIGKTYLEKTKLIGFGTVAWHESLYTLKQNNALEIKKEIFKRVTDPAIKVVTPENTSEQYGRVLNYLSDYLGLIGVVALLISSIGSSYLFQSFFFRRLPQIGVLKTLGVSKRQLYLTYGLVITAVGSGAAVVALVLSTFLLPIIYAQIQKWMTGQFEVNISVDVAAGMIFVGVLLNLLVCFPILKKCFETPVNDLLQGRIDLGMNKKIFFTYVPCVLFLWGISIRQANSFLIGSIFVLSLAFIFFLVLFIFPKILDFIGTRLSSRPLNWPFDISFGLGLRFMTRNRISTVLSILSISTGISLVSVVVQLDKSLKSQLMDGGVSRPSLFLFDIQEDQAPLLAHYAKKHNIPLKDPSPMVRARLVKKNGEKIERKAKENTGSFTTREENTRRRYNNRGVNLSFGPGLNSSEELIEGVEFSGIFNEKSGKVAELSLEKRYANRLQIGLGDTLTFDILGVEVTGKVVNIRRVKWTSFLPNFFITFQPGVIDHAPRTYISVVEKVSFVEQLKIQELIVDRFSNVSIVNVSEIVQKLLKMFNAMALAIGLMSTGCIFVGLFVLFSIVQNQLRNSQKDIALLKVMGFSGRSILKFILSEYMSIVFIASVMGMVMGVILAIIMGAVFLDGVFVLSSLFLGQILIVNLGLSFIIIWLSFKFHYQRTVKDLLM